MTPKDENMAEPQPLSAANPETVDAARLRAEHLVWWLCQEDMEAYRRTAGILA